MEQESTVLLCADLLMQFQEVRNASRQLRAESRSLLMEARQQGVRSPWPHLSMSVEPADCVAPLPDQPGPHRTSDQPSMYQHHPTLAAADADAIQYQGDEDLLTDQHMIDLMAKMLDRLPLEQQIHIAKVLCRRTMAAVRTRLDNRVVGSA